MVSRLTLIVASCLVLPLVQAMHNPDAGVSIEASRVPSLRTLSIATIEHLLGGAKSPQQQTLLAKLELLPQDVKASIYAYYVTKYRVQIAACAVKAPDCKQFNPIPAADGTHGTCMAFVPDTDLMVFGAHNGTIYVYDIKTNTIKNQLMGHTAAVTCLRVSRCGEFLVTGSADKTVRVWDLDLMECVEILTHRHKIKAVAFYYSQAAPDTIAQIRIFDNKARLYELDFNPVAHVRTINVLNSLGANFNCIKPVTQAAFDALGRDVAWSGSYFHLSTDKHYGAMCLLFKNNSYCIDPICTKRNFNMAPKAVSFIGDTSRYVFANGKQIMGYLDEKTLTHTSARDFEAANCIANGSDGRACAIGTQTNKVLLYDIPTNTYTTSLVGHQAPVTAVIFSPDNRYILSMDATSVVRVWDLESSSNNITLAQLWSLIKKDYKPKPAPPGWACKAACTLL